MKRVIVILALIFAFSHVYANEKKVFDNEELIKEVKADMEEQIFFIADIKQEPDVLIYNIEGKLLHSFQKENIDPRAMRNADLIMEINSQKIFIKETELNPSI
jgi:Uma2 family endonuclease